MSNRKFCKFARYTGFTLIELMIVIVIGSILMTIAIPAYTSQVRKSRRTEARTAVLDLAAREERFLSTNNTYTQTPSDLGYSGSFPQSIGSGYYLLGVQVPDPSPLAAATSYLITATATGTQTGDTSCLSFTVNQIGQQISAPDATCWK